jgi:hypothetical protein
MNMVLLSNISLLLESLIITMFTTYNQGPHKNSLQIQGKSNKFKNTPWFTSISHLIPKL